ncbi:hypothetical protein JTB14_019802 [Gonioctena quinquepunctata]|nr:hypothetical protein JTB14_019802 [Gonioctena quinquepunctata]
MVEQETGKENLEKLSLKFIDRPAELNPVVDLTLLAQQTCNLTGPGRRNLLQFTSGRGGNLTGYPMPMWRSARYKRFSSPYCTPFMPKAENQSLYFQL